MYSVLVLNSVKAYMALKTINLLYSIIKVTFSSYDLCNKNNPEVWQTLVMMTAGKEVCNKTYKNAIKRCNIMIT